MSVNSDAVTATLQARRPVAERAARLFNNPLLQATLALTIAGLGRIAFNSALGFRFGSGVFAEYAKLASAALLLGSLAAAGPTAAVTIGIAREWHRSGSVTTSTRYRLATLTIVMSIIIIAVGLPSLEIGRSEWAIVSIAAIAVACYQISRAFGYAIDSAALVTKLELLSALIPLTVLAVFRLSPVRFTVERGLMAYASGPILFIAIFIVALLRRVRWSNTSNAQRIGR